MAIQSGVFSRKIFSNWEGGFHIYSFLSDDGIDENVVYYGDEPPVMDGKRYVIKGYRKRSPKYGLQLILKTYEEARLYEKKREDNMDRIYNMLA